MVQVFPTYDKNQEGSIQELIIWDHLHDFIG